MKYTASVIALCKNEYVFGKVYSHNGENDEQDGFFPNVWQTLHADCFQLSPTCVN
jgi:hypothetical protein